MGLDQYAYAAAKADADWEKGEHREIAYWRKHPNLQGWMEQLWNSKGRPSLQQYSTNEDVMFNGVELELTWDDLEALENDIVAGNLPSTSGFFFGSNSDEYYRQEDLAFVKQAKAELFSGLKVFYNSSW